MKRDIISSVTLFLLSVLFCMSSLSAQQENWTHFRGCGLNGISVANDIPYIFDESSNVMWSTEISGRGWSSPVVYDNQVWVTTASPDGKELYAVCLDFNSGETIHKIKLFSPDSVIRKHSVNTYATPTTAIEKGYVYAHFGSLGTASIRTDDGSVIWTRTDLKCNHVQGPGSSAFLYRDLLILHYEGTDVQYITALDKSTGNTVWKTYRQEEPYEPLPTIGKKAYVSPLLINVNGRDMIISNGSAVTNAYDPATGEEIWSLVRGAESTVAMPFYEDGVVYFYTGFMVKEDGKRYSELLAVNPDGKGDITGTNILWRKETAILQLLTPVIKDGIIYTVDSRNEMKTIDAQTGEILNSSRFRDKFNSSPVYADGKIYFSSISGEVVVLEEGPEMNILATNKMDGEIWATPAILRNSILLRTDSKIYRISK